MAALAEALVGEGRTCVKVVVDDKEFVLCSLSPDKHEQQTLDHTFVEGEEVTFLTTGKNAVHLTGNYVPDQEEDGEDDMEIPPELAALAARMRAGGDLDAMEDVEDEVEPVNANPLTKLLDPNSDVLESDEEDDDYEAGDSDDVVEDNDDDDDDEEESQIAVANADEDSEDSDEESESDVEEEEDDEEEDESESESEEEIDEKQLEKDILAKNKRSAQQAAGAPEPKKQKPDAQPKPKGSNVRNLSNGMIIEETKAGQGEKAKAGKRVSMRYIGKLENGKIFDKNVSGTPFTFALGRGEVIKGWDIGIAGMQVGGERKLIIPAALAYGKKGSPPVIPPNATLIFTVKLLAIK